MAGITVRGDLDSISVSLYGGGRRGVGVGAGVCKAGYIQVGLAGLDGWGSRARLYIHWITVPGFKFPFAPSRRVRVMVPLVVGFQVKVVG